MSKIRRLFLAIGVLLLAAKTDEAERINQEGRILGPAPVLSTPTLFNTSAADTIVSAMQIMPVTNPWNEDISQRPRLANSDAMIAQIKSDLSPTRQSLRAFYEMNYVLVPDNQPRLTIPFLDYPEESDLDGGTFPNGKYPIPPNMPIESWPQGTGSLSLSQWQMDVNNDGSDRHGIMVAPGFGIVLGNVADEIDAERLAGVKWCEVRFEFKCAAASGLDFGRCCWIADVSGRPAVRRMPTRDGRARDAACRSQDALGIHLSRGPLRLIDSSYFNKLPRDGSAVALEGKLCHSEQLDD